MTDPQAVRSGLEAYVPALQLRWLDEDPATRWRDVVGTMVFADVSGFTPLTEKLAKQGRVGAEQLTEILNRVFTGLLDEAMAHGGDLLKFGGDALLLLFEGEGHQRRAAAAAAAMQEALRPFRRFAVEGGYVSLRMSVGVGSGTFQMFLVGDSHRELLVAGPCASLTAELEAEADAGEILLGDWARQALPARNLGSPKAPGVLLRGTPRAERTGPPLAPTHVAEQAVPAGLRATLLDPRRHGEHRAAVLSFLQFKGTDDLLERKGPQAVADALDELVTVSQRACERFDVTFLASDVDRNGGKLLMSTGAPKAGADDPDRMLHCLREIVGADNPLAIRAGVNRGRAFAVDVGSPRRRTFAVMGDPTNLAARVMGKAEPGSVLATASVLATLRDRFQMTPVPPFNVKGKTALVEASVVGPALGRMAAHRDLPFVGRESELARLQQVTESREAGRPPIVVLGEPGSGKSRLIDELQALLAGRPSHRVSPTQYASGSPFLAVRPVLRSAIGIKPSDDDRAAEQALAGAVAHLAPDLETLTPLLGPALGLSLDDTPETAAMEAKFKPERARAAWAEILEAALPDGGLLVVEDAQWLDPASCALVSALLAPLDAKGWSVVITRRRQPGGLEVDSCEQVDLGPLPHQAVVRLINEATSADPLAPHAVAALAERSGGNPLFVQELVDAVTRSGSAELPDTVEALIAARVDRLDPEDRLVLSHAAVLGARIRPELLARFVGTEADVEASLMRLDAFLAPDGEGRLAFRQSLLREVTYELLPFRVRREMHSRAGDLVLAAVGSDAEEFADLLSLHFVRARRFEAAWHWALIAADRARRGAAPVEAAHFLERAVEAARHMDDVDPRSVADVFQQLGEIRTLIGEFSDAADALAEARRRVPKDSFELVSLIQQTGRLREQAGQYTEALRWLGRGLRLAGQLDDEEVTTRARAGLLTYYGATRLRQGRMRSAIKVLNDAVEACQAAGEKRFLAHAYYLLDWAHTDLGSEEADHYRELALPIYEELDDWLGQAKVLNNLGVDAYWEGRWDEAVDYYTRSQEAEARAGDLVQVVTASNNIGEILSDQGHVDEAVPRFEEALRTWKAARYPVGIALATSNLGRAAARRGDFTTAATLLAEATHRFEDAGMEALALETTARDVERMVLTGEAEAAIAALATLAGRIDGEAGHPALVAMAERLAAYAWTQLGDLDRALAHLDISEYQSRAGSVAYETALTLEARARIGRLAGWEGVEEAEAEAVRIFESLGVVATPDVPLGVAAGR